MPMFEFKNVLNIKYPILSIFQNSRLLSNIANISNNITAITKKYLSVASPL
jgi:hypothetical protein